MKLRIVRPLALLVLASCSASLPDERPDGVEIFAEDTVTARISVTVRGDLRIGLRGEAFNIAPNRTFFVSTPASLVLTRGTGTATITSVDSVSRLAVLPIGTPEDSVDAATVAGTVLVLTRLGTQRGHYRLTAARK